MNEWHVSIVAQKPNQSNVQLLLDKSVVKTLYFNYTCHIHKLRHKRNSVVNEYKVILTEQNYEEDPTLKAKTSQDTKGGSI